MDRRIITFISRQFVMALSTTIGSEIWSANLFYVYDRERNSLIFTSSASSKHICHALKNPMVSVSIYRTTLQIALLRGAQIVGKVVDIRDDVKLRNRCEKLFKKRFPAAALSLDDMWIVDISSVKYTDNRLGFGTKVYYP